MSFPSTLLGVGVLGLLLALLVSPKLKDAKPILQRVVRVPEVMVKAEEKLPDALRVGILGASFIAQVAVVFAASKRQDVVVAAVAARDLQRAETYAKKNGIPLALGGDGAYEKLLRSEDVDAIYISLPTQLHRRWVLEALAAGKHVLVEKPAALSERESAEMWMAAGSAGRVLMEAAHYRYHPAATRTRTALGSEGELGNATHITSRFYMIDPIAWFRSTFSPFSPDGDRRAKERIKNFDRWWYCLDQVLWSTQAVSARVLEAEEGRFSVAAKLELELPSARSMTATLDMARDRLWPIFDWSLSAQHAHGSLRFANVGYPFVWHALDFAGNGVNARREQHYGGGETTFEHQLGRFAAAVRERDAQFSAGDGALAAAVQRLSAEILTKAGGEPLRFVAGAGPKDQ